MDHTGLEVPKKGRNNRQNREGQATQPNTKTAPRTTHPHQNREGEGKERTRKGTNVTYYTAV